MAIIYDIKNKTYHGMKREAQRLGVSTGHLSRVLRGERISKRLKDKIEVKEVK